MIRIPAESQDKIASPLTQAPRRRQLEVAGIDGGGSDGTRLRAMGVCDGRSIELVRAGDPLIVRVMGSRIGISRRLAEQITVLHS